jgi:YVTN family beta-propeller protein
MRLFFMNAGQARTRLAQVGAILATAAVIGGCGNTYRPTVTPINTSGPSPQVSGYALVVSDPSPTTDGVATVIDYSGDTILAEAPIGLAPKFFSVDQSGTVAASYNRDNTITDFPVNRNLQTLYETQLTLPTTAEPVNYYTPASNMWVPDQHGNVVDYFLGYAASLNAQIPVGTPTVPAVSPVAAIGNGQLTGQRVYALSQDFSDPTGVACNLTPTSEPSGVLTPIEIASDLADTPIPVGKCPVYLLANTNFSRIFVLNRGGDSTHPNGSITVINTQTNALDSCTPYQSQNGTWITCPTNASIPLPAGPVYAEYNTATQQLLVANYDSNTVSVIDVAEDEYGNDANTYANPSCTVGGVNSYTNCGAITGGFGTVHTINVGNYPAAVTALADGTRAYVANQADGTVSIINLTNYSLEKTLTVVGHPRTVVSTENSLYGKVYVASPDSPYVTIISTVNDLVDTTILVQGDVVDVRVTTQNGTSSNSNITSRAPGWGEPCNLPPTLLTNATISGDPTQCSKQP